MFKLAKEYRGIPVKIYSSSLSIEVRLDLHGIGPFHHTVMMSDGFTPEERLRYLDNLIDYMREEGAKIVEICVPPAVLVDISERMMEESH